MVKENNFNRIFVIVSIVIEFFQMIFFCFSSDFHWGGIDLNFQVSSLFHNFEVFTIIFWIVTSLLVLSVANVAYIGYSFHQGEIKSINLLRTLRWICSLFVTVLFIPILYVLLGALACDYSTSPASLMYFPSVPCWGSQNTPVAIIAAVLVVVFSVFSLVVGLTYYEYDPNMIKTYSRLQNRFEFGALLIKIVIVFVSLFAKKQPVVYAIFSLTTTFLLVGGYIVMVPAYDRKINLVRAGSYAGVFWVNVCMIVALIISDRNNYTSTIAAGVGCPWLIALGAFAADRRIKYLCNPALVDGFVSHDSGNKATQSPSRRPLKKGVKWEQPRSTNNLMKNALYSRLKFPTDVEIAARFVLQDKPNGATIDKAKSVYHTGLCKFPNSPTVMMAYTNFIFTTAGDWQLGYVTLEKLRKMDPFMDISFFVYRYDKDREQRIEGGSNKIGDFVDFMEYKKLMRAAKQYHHMALVCIRRFWKHLLDRKIDVMQLSTLSSKIAFAEKKASESYAKLLQRYPKNIRVLRDYARFLDEVSSDEKMAHTYWKKADRYEEKEMEKLTESHRSANNAIDHGDTPYDGADSGEEPEEHHDNRSSDKSSHTSDTSGDHTSVSSKSSGVRSGLEMAKNDKNNNLKKLGWIMFFTTLFAMTVMFTQLGVLNTQLNNYNAVINALDGAGGISHTGVRVASQVLDVYLFNALYTRGTYNETSEFPFLAPGTDYYALRARITTNMNMLLNNVKSLYWGESDGDSFTTLRRRNLRLLAGKKLKFDTTSRPLSYAELDHKAYNQKAVVNFFNKPIWEERTVVSTGGGVTKRQTSKIDFWTFSFLTSSYGASIATWAYDEILTITEAQMFSVSYVADNVEGIAAASRGLMNFYSDTITKQVSLLRTICIVIFVCAVVLLLLACVVFFMPVVTSIFQYKIKTFHVFTLIPTKVVKHMAKRKISSLGTDASDGEEEEDNYNNNIARMQKSGSDNKFGQWKENEERSGAASDDEGSPAKEKGMVELKQMSSLPNATHTPRPSGSMLTRGNEDEEDEDEDILNNHLPPIQPIQHIQPAPSSVTPGHVSIQVSSEPKGIASDSDGEESPRDKEAQKDSDESDPDMQVSYIQKIKNKIWLKMPANRFTKLATQEEKESDSGTPESKERQEKKMEHAKKASRMNTTSMRQVTRKLHFSYLFAILCFIVAMLVSFITLLTEFTNLTNLSVNLKNSDLRTQYAHLILYDVQALVIYGVNDTLAMEAASNIPKHIGTLVNIHRSIRPPPYQMDILYGKGCFRINQTLCPDSSYPWIDSIDKGVEFTLNSYINLATDLLGGYIRDGRVVSSNPRYIHFRSIAELDIMDGLERLTFSFQVDASNQISDAKFRVGIITGVVCVAFICIHIVLFKPFVRKLREESEHTFSIVRMIPRKLITDIPEIQAFIQESTDVARDDY